MVPLQYIIMNNITEFINITFEIIWQDSVDLLNMYGAV